MRYLITAMLIIVAIIHLLPLSGVVSSERLMLLYGISFVEPNLEIVMRHRAVLFGLLGVFLLYAAFRPAIQYLAFIAGFISVVSFLFLAESVGNFNEQIARVFIADMVALICLLIGFAAYLYTKRKI